MAAVSRLHLREEDADLDQPQGSVSLDSLPYWTHDQSFRALINADSLIPYDNDFSIQFRGSDSDSLSSVDIFDRENQANFVMDLFRQRVEESHAAVEDDLSTETVRDSGSGGFERAGELGSYDFGLDLALGLGIGAGISESENSGFMAADYGDEFFVQRRVSNSGSVSAESSSTLPDPEVFPPGVHVSGLRTDSDENENENCFPAIEIQSEDGIDLWDSLQLEDHGDDDFEWEEVEGMAGGREVLSMVMDADDNGSVSISPVTASEEGLRVERVGNGGGGLANLEWEVLLTPDNLERNTDSDSERDGPGDQYEVLFGQFAENESAQMGRPPASRTIVLNLLTVSVAREDVPENGALCAVCKDDIGIGELAKQLPCSHRYHGDCIVPWLGIRNTCPVCRYELPTDDPEYERRRNRSRGRRP